jgi:hypothetical protein
MVTEGGRIADVVRVVGAEGPDVVEEPVGSQHDGRRGDELDEGEKADAERHGVVHASDLGARWDSHGRHRMAGPGRRNDRIPIG